jgi:hypothetical protein
VLFASALDCNDGFLGWTGGTEKTGTELLSNKIPAIPQVIPNLKYCFTMLLGIGVGDKSNAKT